MNNQQQSVYRQIFDASPAPKLVLTPELSIFEVNEAYLKATMTQRDQIIGRHMFTVFPENPSAPDQEGVPALRASLQRVLDSGETDHMPVTRYDIPRPDPNAAFEERYWKPVNTPVLDAQGRVIYIIHLVEDVTEQHHMESALANQAKLLDFANVFARDAEGKIVFWNSGSERAFGYSRREALGSVCFELLRTRFPQPLHELEQQLQRDGEWIGELKHYDRDGKPLVVWTHWLLHRDERGTPNLVVEVNTDISERKRLEQQLRQRSLELERIAKAKDEFIAIMSHELRNPLAPIRNIAPLLRHYAEGDSQLEQLADMLQRPVDQLTRLLDDLLDVSRVTSGRLKLQLERIDACYPARHAADIVRTALEARQQKLKLSLDHEPLWVDGDLVRLEQVVMNLLNNASRYSPPGSEIRLSAQRQASEIVIAVSDQGAGIKEENLPHIFELFSRGDNDQQEDGLGVGLALVKQIVEMHRGRVEARSAGAGRGSIFAVHLPAAAPPATQRDEQQAVGSAQRSLCILIIDDNRDAADSLAMILSLHGHDLLTAYNGEQALSLAGDQQPDLIFLDLGMPGMDGYAVAAALRQREGMQNVKLVALTGYGQERDKQRTREAGFDHHLTKPVDISQLQAVLARLA